MPGYTCGDRARSPIAAEFIDVTAEITPVSFDLQLRHGRIRAQSWGRAESALVLCVHGISANLQAFGQFAPELARAGYRVVAVDLRGRGRSEITPAGTYGLEAHLDDVLEAASRLGAERFDLVGWSMGALIGLAAARRAGDRLKHLVLIDHAGPMDMAAAVTVARGFNRLDAEVPDPAIYLSAVRAAGMIAPWAPFWDSYYRYELGSDAGKFRPITSKAACLEDLDDFPRHDWRAMWSSLQMPTLLIRCRAPMGTAFTVSEAVRDEIRAAVPGLKLQEVDSNHFTVMTDEVAGQAIIGHLAA